MKYEEIKINVPWGHLSGKWYGLKEQKPLLALHGWQDNAGTFDTLIPLLPLNVSVLSIDLPGHGFSSQIPQGMHYHANDFVFVVQIIMKIYNWKTVRLLGHSLGAMISFQFAALFPDKVDFMILLDGLQPLSRTPEGAIDERADIIDKFFDFDERNRSKMEGPSYSYEECIEKVHDGTFASVSKEAAKYLLNRNLKKSKIHSDKYYFRRDGRLKIYEPFYQPQEVSEEMARRITVPVMLVFTFSGNNSWNNSEERKYFHSTISIINENNPNFELKLVSGSHHVHLNEPEKITELINPFIEKYYFKNNKSIKSKL